MIIRRRILIILVVLIESIVVKNSSAQNFQLSVHEVPLADAIVRFEAQTRTQVAFSDALVETILVSCVIENASRDDALRCLLAGTQISFRFIPPRQYVLIPPERKFPAAHSIAVGTSYGFVADAQSGTSLSGANVFIPGLQKGTTTNEAGFFTLPGIPNGRVRILVSFVGYSTLDTTLVVPGQLSSIKLQAVSLRIDDLLIVEDQPGWAEIVTPPGALSLSVRQLEELPNALGGNDVFSSLALLPGIQRTGEVTGGLTVRGSGPDQNLYLLDGAPIYHPWHAFSLVSTFQTETFKDVKFYRGAFPAEYGGRISSVMNAELRDGAGPEPRATVAINALNARFFIESPIGKSSSFMLSGRRSYIDKLIGRRHPVADASGRKDTLRTGYYFYDWSAKISITPTPGSSLSFTYYTGKDVLDLRLPFDLSLDFSSWLRPADLFFEVDQEWGNDLYSARYRFVASDRVFITSSVYLTQYRAREGALVQPTTTSSVRSTYRVNLRDVGLRVQADYQPSLNHQIRSGILLVHHEFESDIDALVTYAPDLHETLTQHGDIGSIELATFVQDQWKLSSDISAVGGLRASYFGSGDHLQLSPRFSFQWNVHSRWAVVRGSASRHVQYLQRIRDRYSYLYDLVSARWIPSDSTVSPATSKHYSLGLESNPRYWLKITVNAFHRESSNVILPRDEFQSKNGLLGPGIDTGTLLGQYTPGEEKSYGVETSALLYGKSWDVMLSYTGSVAQNRTPELEDDSFRNSRFDVPRLFTVVAQRTKNKWRYSTTMNWRSGYPVTVPVSRFALEDPVSNEINHFFYRPQINNGRLPPYFRLDASLGYQFTFLEASWSAEILIYNILGRRNVIDRSFDPSRDGFSGKDKRGFPRFPLFELQMTL